MGNFAELEDIDREEIARLIKIGFSSGILDSENKRINWKIDISIYTDNDIGGEG